jgi:hypothetical protein
LKEKGNEKLNMNAPEGRKARLTGGADDYSFAQRPQTILACGGR